MRNKITDAQASVCLCVRTERLSGEGEVESSNGATDGREDRTLQQPTDVHWTALQDSNNWKELCHIPNVGKRKDMQ